MADTSKDQIEIENKANQNAEETAKNIVENAGETSGKHEEDAEKKMEEAENDEANDEQEVVEPEAQGESDMDILNRIFMGEMENLPPQASKLVRIFTSSTFTGRKFNSNIPILKFDL
jgi:broad specificity phosphatase PhoE